MESYDTYETFLRNQTVMVGLNVKTIKKHDTEINI